MKLFLDTNLLIDFYAAREPYREFFAKLLAMRAFGDAELWASAKSFTDVFYVCRKRIPADHLQRAFVKSEEFLSICSIGQDDVVEAARREWPDLEDCLVGVAAEKVKADYLVTRDTTGFTQSKVAVVHPLDLFAVLEQRGYVYDEIAV